MPVRRTAEVQPSNSAPPEMPFLSLHWLRAAAFHPCLLGNVVPTLQGLAAVFPQLAAEVDYGTHSWWIHREGWWGEPWFGGAVAWSVVPCTKNHRHCAFGLGHIPRWSLILSEGTCWRQPIYISHTDVSLSLPSPVSKNHWTCQMSIFKIPNF